MSTNKIQFCEKRTLKLTNILKYKFLMREIDAELHVVIRQMQSYITIRGAQQIGPLIQYTRTFLNENQELDVELILMLQCNHYIHNVEPPYSMESVIRVPDAMYCRYTGPESTLKYAYDKINLEAFENDIKLKDYNYTIFVSSNEEEGTIVADVFVPKDEQA